MPTSKPLSKLNQLRAKAWSTLQSDTGDRFKAISLTKKAARYANEYLGTPLADADELERRAAVDAGRPATNAGRATKVPVVLWTAGESRTADDYRRLLDDHSVDYVVRDVEDDLPTREALHREGGGLPLPLLFVAGDCIGSLATARKMAANGELQRLTARGDDDANAAKQTVNQPSNGGPAPLADGAWAATIYGTRTCPWTGRALRLLEDGDIGTQFINIDEAENQFLEERLHRESGQATQPWIYLRARFIGGYHQLSEIQRLGRLEEATRAEDAGRH